MPILWNRPVDRRQFGGARAVIPHGASQREEQKHKVSHLRSVTEIISRSFAQLPRPQRQRTSQKRVQGIYRIENIHESGL